MTEGENMKGTYLGKDKHGYTYYERADLYVYQYNPAGKCVGWIAHICAWENALYRLIESVVA